MFEKEAEEYAGKTYEMCSYSGLPYASDRRAREQAFKDGAEFGYNKANEWHKVADGDLPKDDKQYLVLFYYHYKGKKEMSFGVRDNLHSDFKIHRGYTEQIIAWCEIPTFDKE